MKRLMGVLALGVVFLFSMAALGEPCPPVDINLSVADQAQEWWMVLLDFLLQLVTPIAIAVLTTLAGIAVRKWGHKLDHEKQESLVRLTDSLITSGVAFAEEQGRKALRVDKVKTEGVDKLVIATDFVAQQLSSSGLPRIVEYELVKLIEAKLQTERARPDGAIRGDGDSEFKLPDEEKESKE